MAGDTCTDRGQSGNVGDRDPGFPGLEYIINDSLMEFTVIEMIGIVETHDAEGRVIRELPALGNQPLTETVPELHVVVKLLDISGAT